MSEQKEKVELTLLERIKRIETLLEGNDEEKSNWSYRDLRQIIDKTDLVPNMSNQELMNIAPSYLRIERLLEELGQTDMHTDSKTLKNRLNIIEGCIDILHMSHLGHTNTQNAEFEEMHGFKPFEIKGNMLERLDGIQKKLDKIIKFLAKFEVKMSVKDALEM